MTEQSYITSDKSAIVTFNIADDIQYTPPYESEVKAGINGLAACIEQLKKHFGNNMACTKKSKGGKKK